MKILNYLAKVYHNNLLKHPEVIEYLNKRGLANQTLSKYRIGYCSDDIGKYKASQLGKLSEMEDVSLYEKGHEFFNNRITFPITKDGYVVYMTSRAFGESKKTHMHMHGPLPAPFNHRDINSSPLIIVESAIDCLTLLQQGYHSIATLGLFGMRKEVLDEMSDDVYICYDNDPNGSGQKGALRLGELLFAKSKIAKIIELPCNGKVDVNSFYCSNQEHFNKYFDHLMDTAILYTKTEYFYESTKKEIITKRRNKGSFQKVVTKFGLTVINNRVKICCPFHPDNDPSLIIFLHNNTCKCFGCGKVPTAYELDKALS